MSLDSDFREAIEHADAMVRSVSEASSTEVVREGGWSRKEVLGHLIDSAVHNHVRFVTAANHGSLTVVSYLQQECIRLHGYTELSWSDLARLWRAENELLARVVERIPESRHAVPCTLPDGSTVTLEELIRDYLRHLHDHIGQIAPGK